MNLLDLATQAAAIAADYIRSVEPPRDPARWGTKGASDFVTDVDRTAENLIAELLGREAPGSSVMGEEHSPDAGSEGLVWIVDPLDGTTNFLHRYPRYAVSIAAAIDGELQAGVVTDVTAGITYQAAAGHGATANGQAITVSPLDDPGLALIGTGFPFKLLDRLPSYLRQFARILEATSGVRRAGSAALDLADVAAGRCDGFWELALAPWDFAAGIVLVREAGGLISNAGGEPLRIADSSVVAGNPTMHRWLLEQLTPAPDVMAVLAGGEEET